MKLEQINIQEFKRFADLSITGLPASTKLILLTGPNGSGKTSLFEAFNFWMGYAKQSVSYEAEYHERSFLEHENRGWHEVLRRIQLKFHGIDSDSPQACDRKDFYIRSAYRHEAEFTISSLGNTDSILNDSRRPQRLIQQEQRVSENYQRMVAETVKAIFSDKSEVRQKKVAELADELIGEVRSAMSRVFSDLVLEGPGDPLSNGTFRFKKGDISGFHYKNLSGGEKAAFDLLLDFIVKRKAFNDTVYCIDEPELHMHTHLQARLLEVMFDLIPDNCQLWLSTHSIGMARKAAELYAKNPGQVAFIDFHNQNFDQKVELAPIKPGRQFWRQMFHTALDDLAELVVPAYVVFCEGRKLGQLGKKPSFDAAVYQKIFSPWYPEVEFVPLGGSNEVQNDGKTFGYLLTKLAPGIKTWKIFDKDDRNESEIEELQQENIYVLPRRDIESFLWDDEVLTKLCEQQNKIEAMEEIKQAKAQHIHSLPSRGKPSDDIKSITDGLYNDVKRILGLTGCGNSADAFSVEHLAPLIQPGMAVYDELASAVLAPLQNTD